MATHHNMAMHHAPTTASTTSDDVVPTGDPKDTTELLAQRLAAWKHAVDNLVDYVETTEKVEKAHAKEYEKILKTISSPLKQGTHFEQGHGGIASLFENMRNNTQALVTAHHEAEKNIKGSVAPILERLSKEIKSKTKDLSSGASKSAKAVDKARNDTQKHIELLGQHTASYEATGSHKSAMHDPYVLSRGVHYRLNQQTLEENTNRHEIIGVQKNFALFEGHIVEVIQQAMASLTQFETATAHKLQAHHADMLGSAQKISPNFEWQHFERRHANMLIDPSTPERNPGAISFPNQDHRSIQPLIEGTLERKSRNKLSLGGYSTHHYVVTPSNFLHEYKDNDNTRKDPEPEMSIYLPDATIGAVSGDKFNVKGKDVSKGLTSKLSGSSEVSFRAHSAMDAEKWFQVIRQCAGNSPTEPYNSAPSSPVGAYAVPHTQGVVGEKLVPHEQQHGAPMAGTVHHGTHPVGSAEATHPMGTSGTTGTSGVPGEKY